MPSKKVLIIEDTLPTLASYLQILETLNEDIIPIVAATYETARSILLTEHLDMIIMDLVLPDVVATDVLADIRRIHPEVPIVLVTGFPEQLDPGAVESHRIDHVFTKPFSISRFADVLLSSLDRHRAVASSMS